MFALFASGVISSTEGRTDRRFVKSSHRYFIINDAVGLVNQATIH